MSCLRALLWAVLLLVVRRPADAILVQDISAAMLAGGGAESAVSGTAPLLSAGTLIPVPAGPVKGSLIFCSNRHIKCSSISASVIEVGGA